MPWKYPTRGRHRLGMALLVVVSIWGFVLPRLEQKPFIQSRIKHLHRHGIDPAAFFYTDHEGMKQWEANIRSARQKDAKASL